MIMMSDLEVIDDITKKGKPLALLIAEKKRWINKNFRANSLEITLSPNGPADSARSFLLEAKGKVML